MVDEMRKKSLRAAASPTFWSACWIVFALAAILDPSRGTITTIITVLMAVASAVSVVPKWIEVLSKKYMQDLEDFCDMADNPNQMMKQIEHTWSNGAVATDHCRMDGEYFVFWDGKRTSAFPWGDVREVCTAIVYKPGDSRALTLRGKFAFGNGTTDVFPIAVKTDMKAAEKKLRAIEREIHTLLAKHHPTILLKSEPKMVKKKPA